MTGVGRTTVTMISKQLNDGSWPAADSTGRGMYERQDAVKRESLIKKVHHTIEILHGRGIMTTVNKILQELNFHQGIKLSETFLTRLLHQMGYIYRPPSAEHILLARESPSMKSRRFGYLQQVADQRAAGIHIVYVDESYVNKSHVAARCWLKKGSEVYIPSGKGPRFILVAAGSRDGWLFTRVIRHSDSSSDYHSAMNADHFEELFNEMCSLGQERLGKCLFLLDNAAYHIRLDDEKHRITYWSKLPAPEVKKAWVDGHVPNQEMAADLHPNTKKDILQFIREHPPTGTLKVEKIAREFGHDVLMLPPYRPELNAIEHAWGVCKNYVACHNDPSMLFAHLKEVIEQGLKEVAVSTWIKLDIKVQHQETKQLTNLCAERDRHNDFVHQHPNLVFQVGSSSSSSDDSDHTPDCHADNPEEVEEALKFLADGIEADEIQEPDDSNALDGCPNADVLAAADALISSSLMEE